MIKTICLSAIMLLTIVSFAQDGKLVISINQDFNQKTPAIIKTRNIQQGFSISFYKPIQFQESNFFFAPGIAINSHNFYSDSYLIYDSLNHSLFKSLPDSINYSVNKISYSQISIPLDFRYFTTKWKFSLGFSVSYLLNSKWKFKGDDILLNRSTEVKFKQHKIKNISKLEYGINGQIFYKRIGISCHYPLTNLFEKGKGPEIKPVTIGLSLIF